MFDVIGAARDDRADGPRVSLTYSLRRVADGAEVMAVPAGQLPSGAVTIALTLPADAVGDHELRLVLRDDVTRRTVEDVELLTIER